MDDTTATEALLRRSQRVVAAGLLLLCLLSWGFVLLGAGTGMRALSMSTWRFPPPMLMPDMVTGWSLAYALTMLAMWWVMMIAMMVPGAAPMILLYARVHRHAQIRGKSRQ